MNSLSREKRLIHLRESYESNVERSLDEMRDIDVSKPLQVLAAGVSAIAQAGGLEPLAKDFVRKIEGNTEPVRANIGLAPRITQDTIGAVKDVLHGHVGSGILKVANLPLDAATDGAYLVAGINRGPSQRYSPSLN